jgi:hypothetical protein
LPATYFGNIAYYSSLLGHKKVLLSGGELFVKQTYRNRCAILSSNGRQNLSIPVERPNGKKTKVSQIKISYTENWQKDHLKALESAYNRSPYFEFYSDELYAFLELRERSLLQFNLIISQWLLHKIGIDCELQIDLFESPSTELKKVVDPRQEPEFFGTGYIQTYSDKFDFEPNLSALDLLFNEGPNAISILEKRS